MRTVVDKHDATFLIANNMYGLYVIFSTYPVQCRIILTISLPKYMIEIAFRWKYATFQVWVPSRAIL